MYIYIPSIYYNIYMMCTYIHIYIDMLYTYVYIYIFVHLFLGYTHVLIMCVHMYMCVYMHRRIDVFVYLGTNMSCVLVLFVAV